MFIKKMSKKRRVAELKKARKEGMNVQHLGLDQQYEIVCINGSKYIETIQIERDGRLSLPQDGSVDI